MTSETAYVWVWLPKKSEPVVAGRIDATPGEVVAPFAYGQSYLDRSDAIALYLPELPLGRGQIVPDTGGEIAGCLADAGPDAWGRRVVDHRHSSYEGHLQVIDYLLLGGSNRIGALDFQNSPSDYQPRGGQPALLSDLQRAAGAVEAGTELPPDLADALLHGSSVGGARPKVLLHDPDRPRIVKFSSSTDTRPVINSEHAAMRLASEVGLDVASTEMTLALDNDVLLIDRFDRGAGGTRRLMVSAMTILGEHAADGIAGRYVTYHDLADQIRLRFDDPRRTLRELFSRISFNILVGNTDDHARNHAAFWDGETLTLTPAYDICPQPRAGGEANQAMAYGPGAKLARVADLAGFAEVYLVDGTEAVEIIDGQIETIADRWDDIADEARIVSAERVKMRGAQILNPFALENWKS